MLFRVIVSSALLLAVAAPAGAQSEPYRVGMSAAITGRASGTYAPTYEGFKAYFKRVNDAGGINGHPVALEVEDDRGEPQRAAAAAKKLAETAIVIVNASTSATYKPFMTEAEWGRTAGPLAELTAALQAGGTPAAKEAAAMKLANAWAAARPATSRCSRAWRSVGANVGRSAQ